MKQFLDMKGVQCDMGNERNQFYVSLGHRYVHVIYHIICQN